MKAIISLNKNSLTDYLLDTIPNSATEYCDSVVQLFSKELVNELCKAHNLIHSCNNLVILNLPTYEDILSFVGDTSDSWIRYFRDGILEKLISTANRELKVIHLQYDLNFGEMYITLSKINDS